MFCRTASNHISVRAMTAVAAGLFVGMMAPLTGGPIKPYEVREFSAAVTALANGETSTPSLEPAYYPHSGRIMPDVTGANGNYYYVAPRATAQRAATEIETAQPALQVAENEQLPPIRAATLEGEVTLAMQVLDEPLDANIEAPTLEEEQFALEAIIDDINPDDLKDIES